MIDFPPDTPVLDFTVPASQRPHGLDWGIGRYDEVRVEMYTQDLFEGLRCVHMGVDLGAPAQTPVSSPVEGTIAYLGVNAADGDYGPTIVLRTQWEGRPMWILVGHLAARSLELWTPGKAVQEGARLGWVGEPHENGGWNPHIHVQCSWTDPGTHDMPGVVTPAERERAREQFPDPRTVLGPIY